MHWPIVKTDARHDTAERASAGRAPDADPADESQERIYHTRGIHEGLVGASTADNSLMVWPM
jgi:hypothetical protein